MPTAALLKLSTELIQIKTETLFQSLERKLTKTINFVWNFENKLSYLLRTASVMKVIDSAITTSTVTNVKSKECKLNKVFLCKFSA